MNLMIYKYIIIPTGVIMFLKNLPFYEKTGYAILQAYVKRNIFRLCFTFYYVILSFINNLSIQLFISSIKLYTISIKEAKIT